MKREIAVIFGNAIIWGVVLIACALTLKGTEAYQEIQHILGGGAGFSLLLNTAGTRKKPQD